MSKTQSNDQTDCTPKATAKGAAKAWMLFLTYWPRLKKSKKNPKTIKP